MSIKKAKHELHSDPKCKLISSVINTYPVSLSRNSTNYVIENQNGEQLSLCARRILTLARMLVKKEDHKFYDFGISLKTLSEILETDGRNLKRYLDGTLAAHATSVIDELFHSTMVFYSMDERGTIKSETRLHIMSSCYIDSNMLYLRFNNDMLDLLLDIGKPGNPYFEFIARNSIRLPSVSAMDIYEFIENTLSNLEFQTRKTTQWREIQLPIRQIRLLSFTTNKYQKNKSFIFFMKRQLTAISATTDIEVDLASLGTDYPGINATTVNFNVRRKIETQNIKNKKNEKDNNVLEFDSNQAYYANDELNSMFITFLNQINCKKSKIKRWQNYLKRCVNDSLGYEQEELNTDIACRILDQSIRREYSNLYPININNINMLQNTPKLNSTKNQRDEYKILEKIEADALKK